MTQDLEKKVNRAIRLLKSIRGGQIELAYSGGKDSDVILELAKMAGIEFRAIYKNTTIDPPGTIKHVKEKGVEIVRPKKNFAKLIQEAGYPNRFMRFCCNYLKEYRIDGIDKSIQGIRRCESIQRAKRYKEPTYCRTYGKEKVEVFMPILEWTDDDVKQFVDHYKVQCHPLYYDEKGNFHPERRLGCMCCPLASPKKRIEQFKKYPNMIRFYLKNGQRYLDSHPDSARAKQRKNAYEYFVVDTFRDKIKDIEQKIKPNMFGDGIDCKKFIEDYFKIKL